MVGIDINTFQSDPCAWSISNLMTKERQWSMLVPELSRFLPYFLRRFLISAVISCSSCSGLGNNSNMGLGLSCIGE